MKRMEGKRQEEGDEEREERGKSEKERRHY